MPKPKAVGHILKRKTIRHIFIFLSKKKYAQTKNAIGHILIFLPVHNYAQTKSSWAYFKMENSWA